MIWAKNIFAKIGMGIFLMISPARHDNPWVRRPALVVFAAPLFVAYVGLHLLIGLLEGVEQFRYEMKDAWS